MLGIQSRQCLGKSLLNNLNNVNNVNIINNNKININININNNVQKRGLSILMADLSTVTTIVTTAGTVLGGVGGIWAYKRVVRFIISH